MKIGLLGGSFDPVHSGHIILAKKSVSQLKLDFLIFVPAYLPPHKSRKLVSAYHRKKMLQLAIAGDKKFLISEFELNRKKKIYTYQTLNYFQTKYHPPQSEIYFVIGSDSANSFSSWAKSDNLTQMCKFVVGQRNRYPIPADSKKYGFIKLSGRIPDISSTFIRQQLKKGLSINRFVPFTVENYIKKNHLYK
ncbi:MAG: nicotinate (nicotinamide) nucleotide adenylyltransferase [Elusimicrobiota bacterium]